MQLYSNRIRIILAMVVINTSLAFSVTHPVLISPARIATLAAGNAEWTTIKKYCADNLTTLIGPDYAGWGWRTAVENYATAYQVLKTSDPTTANKYAAKALAMMKVLARHHNYGGPSNAQFLGQGDGVTKTFTLPMTPMSGTSVVVLTAPVSDTALVYTAAPQVLSSFDPIVKISNTSGGPASYASTDYKLLYRDGLTIFALKWLTSNHPATGAIFYVSMTTGEGTVISAGQYTVCGTTLALTTAPSTTQAVLIRYIADNYDQTGNFMGGMSSVTPDGPGYQMRTFNPGLAYGFDLLFDYAGFTGQLKTEFADILNQQIDWYKSYGYERDGDLGNYFIRGLLTGTMFTGYGTDGANIRAAELKTLADSYIQRPFSMLDKKLPGGYGPQGQYTNGVASDMFQIFSIYKDLTGKDLLSQLEWTSNIVPATIHATQPDRKTFYDGGDWSDLPATPLTGLLTGFLTYLPDHPMAPYARQLLKDVGETVPEGTVKDYKQSSPLSYFAKVSGPVYARSGWDTSAVWVSLSAGEIFMDHQHRDQGNITIHRGKDYLLCDGGEYGDFQTEFHNTLLFDDRGAGNLITYPPGQGDWGFDRVGIRGYEDSQSYVYSLADFTWAYVQGTEGKNNSVKAAVRSMVYIRPDMVIVHDRTRTSNANVKKYFNCNFSATPVRSGALTTVTLGESALFMKSLVPANPNPVITAITDHGQSVARSNYSVITSGQLSDNFLHVFEAAPKTVTAMRPVAYINGNVVEGAELTMGDTVWVSVFAKTDSIVPGTVTYTSSVKGKHKDLITDLQRNMQYRATVLSGGQKVLDGIIAGASANGTLLLSYNSVDSGMVTLAPTGVLPAAGFTIQKYKTPAFLIRPEGISVVFSIDKKQPVSVQLFDLTGRTVDCLRENLLSEGIHTINLNVPQHHGKGTYVARITIGSWTYNHTCPLYR